MRPVLLALLLSAALAPCALAGDLPHFDDAPLHAVHFVREADGSVREGWAVGDEGVVWHTRDGGEAWERQPTAVRASLRAVQFLTPYIGWVAGREELPNGGSVGVLLYTKDGGYKWQRVTLNALPGLNQVRFLADGKTGFLAGDCTDQYPSGVFLTTDAGRTWQPVAGKRGTTWLAADFSDAKTGALAGAWDSLAMFRRDAVAFADDDRLRGQGRAVSGVRLAGKLGVAVGQGGLVLINDDVGQRDWALADLNLPAEVRAGWDFHGVALAGNHIWVVGRPGSVLLHSGNRGGSWEVVKTKQPLPLNGTFFADDKQGWAVGEFGAILATADGGKTWAVQRRGGERAAVLCVHARPAGVPLEALAALGADEGYLTTALRVITSDPATAAPGRATEALRLAAAVRRAGGAAGETLWHFPLPQHRASDDKADLLKGWDARHGNAAAEEMLRQLVLTLRVWRPEVVVTDGGAGAGDALVQEAVREAFKRAADPKAFPEQIDALGLQPWKATKLYARAEDKAKAQAILVSTEPSDRLMDSPRDFAAAAAGLVGDAAALLPAQRYFTLLESRLDKPGPRGDLMDGITLAPGGEARRKLATAAPLSDAERHALQARRNLQALADLPGGLSDANKLLAQIGPVLKELPDDQGAPAAFAVANQYARLGQWALAKEVFLLMVDRYPAHPLSADACRWLIRHSASSEARRRQELGQFVVQEYVEYQGARNSVTNPRGQMPHADGDADAPPKPPERVVHQEQAPLTQGQAPPVFVPGDAGSKPFYDNLVNSLHGDGKKAGARVWYENVLAFETKLSSFGPVFTNDPPIQFCLNSARRNLGDVETARKWYAQFSSRQPEGPWRDAALAELWLLNRTGPPPKPVVQCRQTDTRPFLDGKLDDKCWQGVKPLVLRSADPRDREGDPKKHRWTDDYPTEVYLTYDKEYLYVGLVCRQPKERYVPPVKPRPRDADVAPFDRVSLLLDVDRDYSTYYHLEIDQRGCTCEDCWGDLTWNPKWFVAVNSEPGVWQIEAAIPLAELTGEPVTLGKTWACNVTRVVPGQGVQAFSLPADAQPRPEGMGLLTFVPDQRRAAAPNPPAMQHE